MPLTWLVLVILVFFGLYSLAPVFGLDELYPNYLGRTGTLGRGVLFALMVVGGVFWWIGRRRGGRND